MCAVTKVANASRLVTMVGHLFQTYDTIYLRFLPTYTCNHSRYTIYVRFFATYTCVLSCFVGFLFPSISPFSYKRAYICAQKKPIYQPAWKAQKGEGEGEGEKHERGEREGSACYKSRCFCNPPTIFSTNPIMSLSIRDQSQVRGFSAWSELNYFVYRKLSS